jgi:outer membrane protein OmpA-like peptidoglycan-associated protein
MLLERSCRLRAKVAVLVAPLLALAGVAATEPLAPRPEAHHEVAHNPCSTNPCGLSQPRRPPREQKATEISTLDQLIDEFMTVSRAAAGRPGGDERAEFPGEEGRPDWFQLLAVTRAENPLLEEQCKKQALELSVAHFGEVRGIADEGEAVRAAAEHIRMHQDFVKSHGISYSDYLRDISECRSFCAPVVARLMQCQVLSVARKPHGIVLFDLDSSTPDARYENGALSNLVTQLSKDPARRVALIGRASRLGDLRYNRRLSARRALAVRDRLIDLGVEPARLETMWFGWEPPQLSAWVADQYGMRDLYERVGELHINQSVVAVVY